MAEKKNSAFTYVPAETVTIARSLRLSLLGLNFDIPGTIAFLSPTGEEKTSKTIALLAHSYRFDEDPAAAEQKFIDFLNTYHITATVHSTKRWESKIAIDTLQPGLAENLARLQDDHKQPILDYAEKSIKELSRTVHAGGYIPTRPDGKALDVDFAVKTLMRDSGTVDQSADELGVGNALKAAQSPRTGRSRAKTDDVSGDA